MKRYQKDYIDLLRSEFVLKEGIFKLKSGRISPYFFDLGEVDTADAIREVGKAYASAIENEIGLNVDLLFGPAYKGIPLVVATASQWNDLYDVRYAYNRKEIKSHGEGKRIVGTINDGDKVVILDDVMTTGTTKFETIEIINSSAEDVEILAVVVSLDREEVAVKGMSAVQHFTEMTGIPVISILKATEVYQYLNDNSMVSLHHYTKFCNYISEYGV